MSKSGKFYMFLPKLLAATAVVFLAALMGMFGMLASASAETTGAFDEAQYARVGDFTSSDNSRLPGFLTKAEDKVKATEKMKKAYKDMTEGGFDMGTLATGEYNGCVREWNGCGIQEFVGGQQNADVYGRKHGLVIIGTVAENIDAACLVNDMFVYWKDNTGTLGYPIGNQFTLDGATYQNFIYGYMKIDGSGQKNFVKGKFIDGEGAIADSPIAAVNVGEVSGYIPSWAEGKQDKIESAFKAAVTKITTTDAVKEGGYDIGVAFDYATLWRTEDLAFTQPFTGGENTGSPYGWVTQGRIMLSDPDGEAFPLLGTSLTHWASLNGFRVVGYPLSYPFTIGESEYQIFSKAYFVTDELGYIECVKMYAGAISYADKMTLSAKTGMANAQSNFMQAYKNYNNSGANFGIPDGYMTYTGGTFTQTFTAPDGTKNYLVQNGALGSCVKVTASAAKLFGEKGLDGMGAPVSDAFGQDGKICQNFVKGYVVGEEWKEGKNVAADGEEYDAAAVRVHDDVGLQAEGEAEYSPTLKAEFVAKVRELNQSGVYCYAPDGKVRIVKGCAVQEFSDIASSANGKLVLIKNSPLSPVYAISDVFYSLYAENGGIEGGAPLPASDKFCIGGKVFQNFRNGYATTDSANRVSFTENMNVSESGVYTNVATGAQIDPVPEIVGQYGDLNRIPVDLRNRQEAVQKAFREEYARLMSMGFYPGEPDEEKVHQWAPQTGYNWINQTFRNGDSTAAAFGNNSALKIFLTDIEKGAFSVYSEMLEAWVKLGNIGSVGYPTGNQFVYDGDLYQNFTSGYIRCPDCKAVGAEFIQGKEFTAPEKGDEKSGGSNTWIIVVSCVGGAVLVAAIVVVCVLLLRRKKAVKADGDERGYKEENNDIKEEKGDNKGGNDESVS